MYTIYKYDWGEKNRLGVDTELVFPMSGGDGGDQYMCVFNTTSGIDIRRLHNDAWVDEYKSPNTQGAATVFQAKIPFYTLLTVRRRVRRLVLQSCFDRFVAAFNGAEIHVSGKGALEMMLSEFSWTPSETITTILM